MPRDLADSPLIKSVVSPQMVARQAELAYLEDLLAGAAPNARRVQALVISGEAGIGKSRLVAAAETMARGQGFCILRGHCYETDRVQPYAPLRDLFHRYLAEPAPPLPAALAPLLPGRAPDGMSDLPPNLQKQHLFEAFTGFA